MPRTSAFAEALKRLLDDTNFHSRSEWSSVLGVSAPALSQWVNDKTIPRPDLLRILLNLLRTRGGEDAGKHLEAFDALLDLPAESISPIGSRLGSNLRSYLANRSLLDVARSLRGMSPEEQIALLDAEGMGPPAQGNEVIAEPPIALEAAPELRSNIAQAFWRMPRLHRVADKLGPGRQVSLEQFTAYSRAVVVGTPGSGKTCFLRLLQHQVWQMSHAMSLRASSAGHLSAWLEKHLTLNRPAPLILDGLDEMEPEHRREAVIAITQAAQRAPQARIVVASRPIAELEVLTNFEVFSIAPLSDTDLIAEVASASSKHHVNPIEVDRFLCHLVESELLKTALRDRFFLERALQLFEQSAVTPFAEGLVAEECARALIERDHSKGLNRVRAPWALGHRLTALLGEFSLALVYLGGDIFESEKFTKWVKKSAPDVPSDRLLDLMLVQGLFVEESNKCISFSHKILRDYFAARYVIESAKSATEYFKDWRKTPGLGSVMRMACGLANDATPLVKNVLNKADERATDLALLADIIAQPLQMDHATLFISCKSVVSWLDHQTSDWKVYKDLIQDTYESKSWVTYVYFSAPKQKHMIASTLCALHRARSGPAYEPLKEHLSDARSHFLAKFAEALDVEGRLKVDFDAEQITPETSKNSAKTAMIAVESLQLL
jgi:hypothetical protein